MPHRPRGAGATEIVSIRTRHFCRVMPGKDKAFFMPEKVSIRTRHFCRVMLVVVGVIVASSVFQSAPDISAG